MFAAFPPSPTRPVHRIFLGSTEVTRIALVDNGSGGDPAAGDGRFTSGALRLVQDDPPTVGTQFPMIISALAYEFADTTISVALTGTNRLGVLLYDADPAVITAPQVTEIGPDARRTPHVVSLAMPPAGSFPSAIRGIADIVPRYFERVSFEPDFLVTYQVGVLPVDGVAAFYVGGRNDVSGIGQPLFQSAGAFAGRARLQGVVLMRGAPSPIGNRLVVHELAHRWFAYLDPALGISAGAHWVPLLDRPYDGFSDGKYNDFELYLIGLIPSDSVQPRRVGTAGATVDDVIARHGQRLPSWPNAQRDFTMATVIVHDRLLTPEELALFELVAAEFGQETPHPARSRDTPWTFFEATGGRGRMTTRIP